MAATLAPERFPALISAGLIEAGLYVNSFPVLAKIVSIVRLLSFEAVEDCVGISTSSMAAHELPKGGE